MSSHDNFSQLLKLFFLEKEGSSVDQSKVKKIRLRSVDIIFGSHHMTRKFDNVAANQRLRFKVLFFFLFHFLISSSQPEQ